MGILDDIKDFVSPYLNGIIEAFKAFMEKVKGVVKTIFTRIVDFKNQIVGWFKNLNLIKGIHIPFMTNRQDFKEMLANAPKVNVDVFTGVYNEQTDEITNLQYIAANQYDKMTAELLNKEELVVLT